MVMLLASPQARIMYAFLLLLTTIVSCVLLAPGLQDKLKSVPFCKSGDGDENNEGLLSNLPGVGVEGFQVDCSEAVGYLAVYRFDIYFLIFILIRFTLNFLISDYV